MAPLVAVYELSRVKPMPSLTSNSDGSPHIHTYVRAYKTYATPDPERYRCAHPQCTHTALRKDLKGKLSLCSKCLANTLILNYENLRLARPRCWQCSGSKKNREKIKLQNLLEIELGGTPNENPSA